MPNSEISQQAATLSIDQTLQRAIVHHQAGELQDAERLYRTILQAQPSHSDANHNLGVLAVQVKQPAAGLPHFKAALEANPSQGQYWLSYIDALILAGQSEVARQMLKEGRQRGLQGEATEALVKRLAAGAQGEDPLNNAEYQQASKKSPPVSSAVSQSNRKKHKTNTTKPDKSTGRPAWLKVKNPRSQEINTLVSLFNEERYTEAINLAQTMTMRFPRFCRISKRRRADQVDCDARPLDESTCSTSKGCAFRST